MNKHILLFLMILFYLTPIFYVYYYYNANNSVSSIICNENCKYIILFFMVCMGIATICYELKRNDYCSLSIICLLLISIYGLIYINENNSIHYIFAFIVFIAILLFMIWHCYLLGCNNILLSSLFLEILLLVFICMQMNKNIFYGEVLYIVNFAFFYLYLHFIH